MDKNMKIPKLNSPGGLCDIFQDNPQEERELGYNSEKDFQLTTHNLDTSLSVPELNSAGDMALTQDQDGHGPLKGSEASPALCQDVQAVASKEDSSPHSPGDLEMPTLVAQVPLDKDESSQDIVSPSSMPDLKNSIAMNNPTDCVYPEVSELPMQSCHGQAIRANCEVGSLEKSCMGSTLVVVVGHNGVDGKSPENFSEHSPSTSDYLTSDAPVEGSPVDEDRQPCSRNPMPPCKGQVLNGEHSPGFSLRDSCDVSSLEGESSRPMLSPQEPRSVGSEGVGSIARACDTFSGGDDLDPDSPPILDWSVGSPEACGQMGQAAEGVAGEELSPAGTTDSGRLSPQLNSADYQRQYGFSVNNQELPPFLDSPPTPTGSAQDEDAYSKELPVLVPEEPELSNTFPNVWSAAGSSKDISERLTPDVVMRHDQKPMAVQNSVSPLKTRGARGKARKRYHEFYDATDPGSDGSDETFDPSPHPKRKKRRISLNKRRRSSQNQAACSWQLDASQLQELQTWKWETLQFDRVESKFCLVLKEISGGRTEVRPGSIQLYRTLQDVRSGADELPSKMAKLSMEDIDKSALQAMVLVQIPSAQRLKLLCSAMAGILKKMKQRDLSAAIRSSGTVDSKLGDLDQILSKIIRDNGW